MLFHDFLKRHDLRFSLVNILQSLFGKMQVFKVVQILPDSLNPPVSSFGEVTDSRD